MRDAFRDVLSCTIPRSSPIYKSLAAQMRAMGIGGIPTVQDVIILGMVKKASTSPQAAEFIRDTIGEKPVETFEDKTPQSPIILGVIDPEKVAKAKAEHDARQFENDKR